MKKTFVLIMTVLAVLTLASCASTEASVEKAAPVAAPQILGKNGIPQPDWVAADVSTQDMLKAAGYGKMVGVQNSIKKAEVEARNALAEYISVSVDEIITNYVNDAGEGANRQALDAFETISKQQATAMLHGSKREAMWEDAEGGVWVLVSIPTANIESQLTDLAEGVNEQVFKENDAAAAANAKMDDAIAKYFGTI